MEQVLVVDRAALLGDSASNGFFSVATEPERARRLTDQIRKFGYFAARSSVEHDPSRKQIIPYSIVTDGARVLLLKRLSGGGEKRLHHLYSIGVGGHINRVDQMASSDDILLEGARRELLEEISLTNDVTMEIVGFVNDDSNPVGSVHFGVVLRVPCDHEEPTIRETDQLEGRMVPWQDTLELLNQQPDCFETWSRIVLNSWCAISERCADET